MVTVTHGFELNVMCVNTHCNAHVMW